MGSMHLGLEEQKGSLSKLAAFYAARAAGGVGLIVCQWAKALGATVIGTVSTEEKATLARSNGCDHTILYTKEDFSERVLDITDGAKLPVVFDSI